MAPRPDVEKLTDYVVASIEAGKAVEKPFFHLEFDRIFPEDIYASIIRLMPVAADYRPLPGRRGANLLPDGSSTRVKIDLFPEYTRHLQGEKRALWDLVGRALCSAAVQNAFVRRLTPGLERRFGAGCADVGMYPIPVLTRDIPGYRITPHTDTHWKGITVQFYLPPDAANTNIGTIFHDVLPDGSMPKATQMRFAPNSGYAFAVGDNTWHSADPVGGQVKTRDSDLADLFRRCRPAALPTQPRQARRQFRAQRGQARREAVRRRFETRRRLEMPRTRLARVARLHVDLSPQAIIRDGTPSVSWSPRGALRVVTPRQPRPDAPDTLHHVMVRP